MHIASKYGCLSEPKASWHRSIYGSGMCNIQKTQQVIVSGRTSI